MEGAETRHAVHIPAIILQSRKFDELPVNFKQRCPGGNTLQLRLEPRRLAGMRSAERFVEKKVKPMGVLLQDTPVGIAWYIKHTGLAIQKEFGIPFCVFLGY